MKPDIKTKIREALAGSSSQKPVDTLQLFKISARKKVESALLEMYRQQEICCCTINKGEQFSVVWWISSNAIRPHSYGRTGRGIR